jgi:hypothetical protein
LSRRRLLVSGTLVGPAAGLRTHITGRADIGGRAVVRFRIFTPATATGWRDGEKQVNGIRLAIACNCAKRNLAFLPRLKSRVSGEQFL